MDISDVLLFDDLRKVFTDEDVRKFFTIVLANGYDVVPKEGEK